MPSPSPCADPAAILITGASSGLGAALAVEYATAGITLFLCGRDEARLAAVAATCRARGAEVLATSLDVTGAEAVAAWVAACDRHRPLDLVIANAGISAGTAGGTEGAEQTRAIFAVNLDGTVNTVMPAIAAMRPRGRGQIALMSSMASFRGVGGAPAYCGSKAAVRVWGEALRGALAADGIAVSVICPGFVATPMTAINDFAMPFLMTADSAARLIRRKLAANRGRIAFPGPMAALSWLAAALPDSIADRLTRHLPAKR
ncbi:SDR family NAD(P)-dependent oxidoreductase [Magnetospirillum fulvum]|uniref:Short-chain dehydrogenase n=1 Tax=Magnetospirillum fulvum TaxID=1082 RepID=A0A1H6IPL0_MAGFU|nr:SDR family NAD(P)-dependent oxidoreductase [Magnetospirillum fulvum]SEH48284.1 Short-chain dehydrogenase [Magnetospirillum fulvum]